MEGREIPKFLEALGPLIVPASSYQRVRYRSRWRADDQMQCLATFGENFIDTGMVRRQAEATGEYHRRLTAKRHRLS